ncbi:MAG TPA: hypothetical protein VGJ94_13670 [Syntrophorhabdaceae bacterium]
MTVNLLFRQATAIRQVFFSIFTTDFVGPFPISVSDCAFLQASRDTILRLPIQDLFSGPSLNISSVQVFTPPPGFIAFQ